ncbi:MAG: hypothetical protein ACFFAU_20305 [Candidatus Hodarchaeota archaeon]
MKKIILFGCLIVLILTLKYSVIAEPDSVRNSWSFQVEWKRTFGKTGNETVMDFLQTTDGGYALLGFSESNESFSDDYLLVKTNSSGHTIWNRTYSNYNDYPQSLIQTLDGGYAFVGTSIGFDNVTEEVNLIEITVIKTDSYGIQDWNYTLEGDAWGSTIIQTADNGYIFSANINNSMNLPVTALLKINSSGYYEWNQTLWDADIGYFESMIQTLDGGYAITATVGEEPNADILLMKVNGTGHQEWNKSYSRKALDREASIIQLANGSFVIAGTSGSEWHYTDIWLIKTDVNGEVIWNTTYGESLAREENDIIIQTIDGGFVVLGGKESLLYPASDVWVIKIDVNGQLEWETLIGKAQESDWAINIFQTAAGDFVIAGNTEGKMWLLKLKAIEDTTTETTPISTTTTIETTESTTTTTTPTTSVSTTGFLNPIIMFVVCVMIIRRRKRTSK